MDGAERTLHLLPVWLGLDGGIDLLTPRAIRVAASLRTFFAENERGARRALRRMSPSIDLGSLEIHRLDKDTTREEIAHLADRALESDSAILSEAGMPCIADPGALLVAEAHRRGIRVVPHAGPSSLLLALAASGMDGQHFTFHGYLPREAGERKRAIGAIDMAARRTGGSHLFIETPYRNNALLNDLLANCDARSLLCIAVDIGQDAEAIHTRTIAQWRSRVPDLDDRPAVFVLGR